MSALEISKEIIELQKRIITNLEHEKNMQHLIIVAQTKIIDLLERQIIIYKEAKK